MTIGSPKAGKQWFTILSSAVLLFSATTLVAETGRVLQGHVPAALVRLQPAAHLPSETNLYLSIALPLRNQSALTALISELYEPANPKFRQWLTAEQFAEAFCPTAEDYGKVISFAERHGLKVLSKHPNRMLVDVTGSVAQIERAFQIRLNVYPHPSEHRIFYAPDSEPTVEADVPILHVAGLDNYVLPHPLDLKMKDEISSANARQPVVPYATGSGPGGDFTGKDFRAAYAPGVTNKGAGQYIAIVDVGGLLSDPWAVSYNLGQDYPHLREVGIGFGCNRPFPNLASWDISSSSRR